MNFFYRLLALIFTIFGFIFLIFSTFVSYQYEGIEEIKIDKKISNYNKVFIDSNLKTWLTPFEYNSDNKESFSGILLEKMTVIDEIYSSNLLEYSKKSNSGTTTIELGKGIFVLNINDLNNKYILSHKGFNLEPLGTGVFYIDTTKTSKILIFSKNTLLKLGFKNLKTGKILNTAYLYPHEYFKFNPLKNLSIKNNADFIRVKDQVFLGGYYSDRVSFNNIKGTLLETFLGKNGSKFLSTSLRQIDEFFIINKKHYNEIISYKRWMFPGREYIEKNISYFYNKSKKKIYLKNKIINNLLKLFSLDKEVNFNKTSNIATINEIKKDLNILKEISIVDYNKMENIINYFYSTLLTNDYFTNNNKIYFSQLSKNINYPKENIIYPSLVYLKTIYSQYDNGEIKDLNLYLNTFLLLFYKDLDIKIVGESLYFDNLDTLKIDYLSYFLKSYLIGVFSNPSSFESSLKFINNYIIINKSVYFDAGDIKRMETGISEGVKLFSKLNVFLRNNLFNLELDNENFLVLKPGNSIDKEIIISLEKNIFAFIKIFEKNINKIEDKTLFLKFKEDFNEYFSAILNYSTYRQEYDEAKNNLIEKTKINDINAVKFELTQNEFIKYISTFNGIEESANLEINIIDKKYYQINNLDIKGHTFSFNLYPYEKNRISSINIDGDDVRGSYELDEKKILLEKKIKTALMEEKEKYDFKNFFINTFLYDDKSIIISEDVKKKKILPYEEKIVKVYKRFILLGNEGEFNIIKNLLKIDYYDLEVTKIKDNYNIFINGSLLFVSIKGDINSNDVEYNATFFSDYIFTDEDHYFNNIEFDIYTNNTSIKKYLFSGEKISFNKKVEILEFEEKMQRFFSNVENLTFVYNTIYNSFPKINNLKIFYNPDANKSTFTFNDNNNNNVEINIKGSIIAYVTYDGEKISDISNISKLKKILLLINKEGEKNLEQK